MFWKKKKNKLKMEICCLYEKFVLSIRPFRYSIKRCMYVHIPCYKCQICHILLHECV